MSKRLDAKLRRVYSAPEIDMRYARPSVRIKDALTLLDRIARVCNLQWNVSTYLDGSRLRYDAGWGMEEETASARSLSLALARLANDPRVIENYRRIMERLESVSKRRVKA